MSSDSNTTAIAPDRTPLVTPNRAFLSLLRYNLPYWRAYAVGAGLSILFILAGLYVPEVIRGIVGQFTDGTMTTDALWKYFAILVGISTISGIARYFQRTIMIGASRRFEYDLRNDYFRHVERLSQDFFNRNKTGDIMARATNDLNYVRLLIGPGIMGAVDIIRVPLTLFLMIHYSPSLTFVALWPMPFVVLMVYGFVMYTHHHSKLVQEQFSEVTARAQENLAGARVVKAYGALEREEEDFQRESALYMRKTLRLSLVMVLVMPMIGVVMGLTALLILWRGGVAVINGELALENLMAFNTCLMMLLWPLAQFGWLLTIYQRGAVSMNRISEILAETPRIQDSEDAITDTTVAGRIVFENVSFEYEDDHPVLDAISFEAEAGSTVALVGPTGCGKTSVVSLIARQYDPTQGRVLIDGLDARKLPLDTLRKAIGLVPQDTFLFSDSIRANLTFGRPDAPQDAIDAACEVAQFAETVAECEQGYETLLGERGVNLSGGQKQRLTIARAVLRDPQILILDDALSSVDTHTEEMILQGLNDVMAERTSIIISHRVSTVQHADKIIVLDEGRIAAQGTHAELLAADGIYADMYRRQLLEEEIEQE